MTYRPGQMRSPLPPGTAPALRDILVARSLLRCHHEALIRIAASDAWAPAREMAERTLEYLNHLESIMKGTTDEFSGNP